MSRVALNFQLFFTAIQHTMLTHIPADCCFDVSSRPPLIPDPLPLKGSTLTRGQSGGLADNKPTVITDKDASLVIKPRDLERKGCCVGRSNRSGLANQGAKAKCDNVIEEKNTGTMVVWVKHTFLTS